LEEINSILKRHVPEASLTYCQNLWSKYRFEFRLRSSRISKVGDFTPRKNQSPLITVNQDIDPYLFLITYVHEVAHHDVHLAHGNRVDGHGSEWKTSFRLLMEPVMNSDVFPDDLLAALQQHMKDPAASNFSDPDLMKVLRQYDPKASAQVFLADIPEGSIFGFRGKWFKKGETKRTRALCHELKTRRKYFVPVDLAVEGVQLGFF
jgi:hypothetical protein